MTAKKSGGGHRLDAAELNRRAWATQFSQPEKARSLAFRALEEAERESNQAESGWAQLSLAFHELRYGSIEAGEQRLSLAEPALLAVEDRRGIWLTRDARGFVLMRRHQLQPALELYLENAAAPLDERHPEDFAWSCNGAATAYSYLGRHPEGLRWFYRAAGWLDHANQPVLLGMVLANIGVAQRTVGNDDDALAALDAAWKQVRRSPRHRVTGQILALLAACYLGVGRYNESLKLVGRLEQIGEAAQPVYAQGFVHLTAARAYYEAGDFDRAEQRLQRALPVLESTLGDPNHAVYNCLHGLLALRRGELHQACERLNESWALLAAERHPSIGVWIAQARAQAIEQAGDLTAALAAWRDFGTLRRQFMQLGNRSRAQTIRLELELEQARREREQSVRARALLDATNSELLSTNAELMRKIAEARRLERRLRIDASRDALTGLSNRRYLFENFAARLERAQRDRQQVVVALIDLDRFKQVNDRHGHATGDLVLRTFARVLRRCVRPGDLLGRYGGEEFCLVVPAVETDVALARLETLRKRLDDVRLTTVEGDLLKIEFSAGLAVYPLHADSLDGLLAAADKALYRAKASGRGCTVVAGTPDAPHPA